MIPKVTLYSESRFVHILTLTPIARKKSHNAASDLALNKIEDKVKIIVTDISNSVVKEKNTSIKDGFVYMGKIMYRMLKNEVKPKANFAENIRTNILNEVIF